MDTIYDKNFRVPFYSTEQETITLSMLVYHKRWNKN